jgi:hypothetical protein
MAVALVALEDLQGHLVMVDWADLVVVAEPSILEAFKLRAVVQCWELATQVAQVRPI